MNLSKGIKQYPMLIGYFDLSRYMKTSIGKYPITAPVAAESPTGLTAKDGKQSNFKEKNLASNAFY